MSQYTRYPVQGGGSGQIPTYANASSLPASASAGAAAITVDTDTLYIYSGSSWLAVASPSTILSIGTIDTGTPSANGAQILSNALVLQSASASNPGLMSTGAQAIAGSKTFSGIIKADAGIERSTAGTLSFGTDSNSSTINIGNSGATVNIQGTVLYENVAQLQVTDPLITLNKGGAAGSGAASGIEIEENSIMTGYAKTSGDRNSWTLKAPNTAGLATITPGASGITLNQSSHDALTLGAVGSSPNANAASLSGQVLTLQPANASNPGVVTTAAQTFAGAKTFSSAIVLSAGVTGAVAATGAITGTNLTALGIQAPEANSTFINSPIPGTLTGTVNLVIGNPFAALTTGGTNILIGYGSASSLTTGSQNTIIGVNANNTGNGNGSTQVGYAATSGGNANTVIGNGAGIGSGVAGVAIGGNAGSSSVTGSSNIFIGYTAGLSMTSGAANIIMSREGGTNYPATSSNSFIAGSPNYPINNAYFGQGYASATPTAFAINGTGGFGSNIAGADLVLAGGAGTGTGAGGSVLLKVAKAGSTGSTLNTLSTVLSASTSGVSILDVTDNAKVMTFDLSGMTTAKTLTIAAPMAHSVTYTIPDSSSNQTFVMHALAQTLFSKTFADATTSTKQMTFDMSGATASTKTTLAFAQTVNRTVTIPDATDTLVGKATTDTLTNKTISAANNTITLNTASFVAPTVQKFTSGTGTYTTPTSPRSPVYIRVRMVGGGGGGAGSGSTPTNGSAGGNTTFGTTLLVANGGGGGRTAGASGVAGGSASLGTGPVGTAIQGGNSTGGQSVLLSNGISGTESPFGGAGAGGQGTGSAGSTGADAIANSGSGGGGAGSGNATGASGGGGAAGGFVDAIIASPSATYAYAVGASGAKGTLNGGNGSDGGAGGSGYIEVTEYYQ